MGFTGSPANELLRGIGNYQASETRPLDLAKAMTRLAAACQDLVACWRPWKALSRH